MNSIALADTTIGTPTAAEGGKPPASISLDLDNQWAYMKTHGDAGWESFPSYLDVLVPYALEELKRLRLTVTFFVVGQDAALHKNQAALGLLTQSGHEVGNHSFHHEQWVQTFSRERIRAEITDAAAAIMRATGRIPRGYRGPGFSWSEDVLEVLADSGYEYDASTLPTYIGPLARMYYFRRTSLAGEEMEKRGKLFGTFADGRRPVRPYLWQLASGRRLLEIPVTTIPIVKTPFHLSYLLYLSRHSILLMTLYLRTALFLCRATRTEPSFLLHPLDLLGPEQAPGLAFFPGMELGAAHKREVFRRVLGEIGRRFTPVTMGEHARRALRRTLPTRAAGAGAGR